MAWPKGRKRDGPVGKKPRQRNKRTELQILRAEEGGIMPLDYMLAVMRDEKNPADLRLEAAHKAAPYVHQKLAQRVELKNDIHVRIRNMNDAELELELSRLLTGEVIEHEPFQAIAGPEGESLAFGDRDSEEEEAEEAL